MISKSPILAALLVAASAGLAVAQDASPAVAPAPGTAVVVPAPAPKKTPEQLVGKSIRDLAHGRLDAVVKDDVTALQRGPLLIHGNYCGIGNRPGTPPIDALDAACMRHDACTTTGAMPSCACDDRLRLEATRIAHDPSMPPDLQATAAATASAMAVLICKQGPHAPAVQGAAVTVTVPATVAR